MVGLRSGRSPRSALLALAALVLVACVAPPLAVLAREHVATEALQFALLGYVVPPLFALGLSGERRARLAGFPLGERAVMRRTKTAGPGQRRPLRRPRATVVFVTFVLLALAWRSPAAVNGLHRHPALLILEVLSLTVAGCALWIELVDRSAATATIPGPMRMAMAAVSMWSIWIVAYLLGFATVPWYRSFHHVTGGLSMAADQEIACAILWAFPGITFIPMIFAQLVSWLRSEEGKTASTRPDKGGGAISQRQPSAPMA